MKRLYSILLLSVVAGIMLTGSTLTVAAEGNGKGNDDGKGNPNQGLPACENSQGKAPQKNPHCTADDDGDAVPNWQDVCPTEAGDGEDGCPIPINLGSDIAIPGFFSNLVSVLLNNGDGTFGTATNYPVGGNNPDFAAVGDFNNDGNTDISVSVNGWGTNNKIAILLGNGDGTFGTASLFSTGTGPSSQAISDYNNDGNLDIAVQGAPGNVGWMRVHLGNGLGGFANGGTEISPPTPNQSKWVTGGDFDGDGNSDLATANVATMVTYQSNGDGTFATPTVYPLGHCDARAITNGDIDGDGDLDIVTANVCGSISTFLNNGDGTFATAILSSHNGYWVYNVAIADFDNDGNADVLGSGQGGTILYKGNGDGTFTTTVISPVGGRVVPGDFNEDGNADFAANEGPNFVSVTLGNGDGTFGAASLYPVANNPATLAVGNFN